MEITVVKIALAGVFFVSLIVAACWAGGKMNEYKDYFEERDDDEDR